MNSFLPVIALAVIFGLVSYVESRTIGFFGETAAGVAGEGGFELYGGNMNAVGNGMGLQGRTALRKQVAGAPGVAGVNRIGDRLGLRVEGGFVESPRMGGNVEDFGGRSNYGDWDFGLRKSPEKDQFPSYLHWILLSTIGFFAETGAGVEGEGGVGLYGGNVDSGRYGLGLQGGGAIRKQVEGAAGIEGVNRSGDRFGWGVQGGFAESARMGGNLEVTGGRSNYGGWGVGLRGAGDANANTRIYGSAGSYGRPYY